jgi:hypothetical protein
MKLSITDASKPGYFNKSITFNNEHVLKKSVNISYVIKNIDIFVNELVIYLR